MRDLVLTMFIAGMIPISFKRPYLGLLIWSWLTYMNPHRLTWSFAYEYRFNYFIAMATLAGILYSKTIKLKMPLTGTTVFLLLFTFWTSLTTYYAFNSGAAWWEWNRFMKIQLMVVATLILTHSKKELHWLAFVIAVSIGFYGIKGGVFTISTGGSFRVLGPEKSFFKDNNTFALALLMVIPLFRYLQLQTSNYFLRVGYMLASGLSVVSVLGSYSRGGLIGLAVLTLAYWMKTRKKFIITIAMVITFNLVFAFMPTKWHERMESMTSSISLGKLTGSPEIDETKGPLSTRPSITREHTTLPLADTRDRDLVGDEASNLLGDDAKIMQDLSVQGRFDAWNFAINVANDRPFLGGGFQSFNQKMFNRYYPGVYRRDAHSIYFEVLGEQGYAGLVIWIVLHLFAINNGRWVIRKARPYPDLTWARDMAGMVQVGLLSYYAAGVFLGLAYFDLPYHMIAILIMLKRHVRNELREKYRQEQASNKPVKSIF